MSINTGRYREWSARAYGDILSAGLYHVEFIQLSRNKAVDLVDVDAQPRADVATRGKHVEVATKLRS